MRTMNKKEITINGKQFPVVFDMQTMMNFESISKISFFESKFKTISDRVALIAAAVYSADKDSDITIEAIVGNKDFAAVQQIIAAFVVVSGEMEQFFTVPEIENQNETETENQEGDNPKN